MRLVRFGSGAVPVPTSPSSVAGRFGWLFAFGPVALVALGLRELRVIVAKRQPTEGGDAGKSNAPDPNLTSRIDENE